MSIIGENLAKAFLDDPHNVDLSKATEITDEAAEALSKPGKYKNHLNLDGLTELSDATAESLSKQGDLYLSGLTKLSDAAAESLSKHEGKINGKSPKEWVESLLAGREQHHSWLTPAHATGGVGLVAAVEPHCLFQSHRMQVARCERAISGRANTGSLNSLIMLPLERSFHCSRGLFALRQGL